MDSAPRRPTGHGAGLRRLLAALGMAYLTAGQASATTDDVIALCLARGIDDRVVCACAGERLTGVIGAEALRLYGWVGREFMGDMQKGMDIGLSWDMAIEVVSRAEGIDSIPLRQRMHRAGRDHRLAIHQCREDG